MQFGKANVQQHPAAVGSAHAPEDMMSSGAVRTQLRRQELRLRIKGATGLQGPNHNAGPFEAFCVARLGDARYRTHTANESTEPEWEHEVLFGSDAVAQGGGVVTLEVWDERVLADQLLGKAYIDLALYDDSEVSITQQSFGSSDHHAIGGLQRHSLALLPGSSKAPSGRRTMKRPPLTRSSHVSMQGELRVEWCWVDEPALDASGKPPRVVSFAARPGGTKRLPSVTQAAGAVLYEAPCVAFVKLSVREVCLGTAGALAAPREVLRSVRGLLLGGQRAQTEMDTLASRSGAASCASSKTGSPRGPAPAPFDWQQVTLSEEEGEGPPSKRWTNDSSDDDNTHGSPSSESSSETGHRSHRPLFVVCSVSVGKQQAHRTKPVAMDAAGIAPVQQSMTFTVLRPLVDQEVVFELQLQRGRSSRPQLTLQCRYSLLDLLVKSPQQASSYEAWRSLRMNTLTGVHVPMPGLPEAYIDLGAFLADADCRAGIYGVPALAAHQPAAPEAAEEAATAGPSTTESDVEADESMSSAHEAGPFAGMRRRLRHLAQGGSDRAPQEQQQQQQQQAGQQVPCQGVAGLGQDLWHDRVKPGLAEKMDDVAEATRSGMAKAVSLLPAPVAKRVRRGVLGKLLAPRAEVLSLGQVHVPTLRRGTAEHAAADAAHGGTSSGPAETAASVAHATHSSSPMPASTFTGGPMPSAQLAAHPNVAVSGSPAAGPAALLRLTLRRVHLERDLGPGVSIVLRCGPHWLHADDSAVPVAAGDGPPSTDTELQVVCPVYAASQMQFTLVLQRRGVVLAIHAFQAYGLLPLLMREHTKTLSMYSAGHDHSTPVARITLSLAASAVPGSGGWLWGARLLLSYVLTPDTLALHTSTIAATEGHSAQAEAHALCVGEWLGSVQPALPAAVVTKVLGIGQRKVSLSRMKTQLARIKACLDWVPRRFDPVALYQWHTPWHNILLLWVLSQACFHPGKWLLTLALLAFMWMLRRFAIQLRSGIFGFELVAQHTEEEEEEDPTLMRTGGTSGTMPSPTPGTSISAAAAASPISTSSSQRPAPIAQAEQRQQQRRWRRDAKAEAARLKKEALRDSSSAGGPSGLSLAALDNVDLDELASVRGLLRLARAHAGEVGELALLMQTCLEGAARAVEKVHALVTGQDIVASVIGYCCAVATAAVAARFGLGLVVYCWCVYVLRPPMLRGVPGVVGPLAFYSNLSSRGRQPVL